MIATSWLEAFHAGESAALDQCYRNHFDIVRTAVGRIIQGADRDTVVHQLFYRLVSEPNLRRNFQGGNFDAWLTTVARNAAIDFRRRYERDHQRDGDAVEDGRTPAPSLAAVDAKLLVEQFRRDHLPPKLDGVFETRFLRQLSQREAAAELGIQRTTLVYQEQQVREALRVFLLEDE